MLPEHDIQIREIVIRYLLWRYPDPDSKEISVNGEKPTSIPALIEEIRRGTPRGNICVEDYTRLRSSEAIKGRVWDGFLTEENFEAMRWAEKGRADFRNNTYEHRPHEKYFRYYHAAYKDEEARQEEVVAPKKLKKEKGKAIRIMERRYNRPR